MFIELKDINFKYRNARDLTLENIHLSINKGTFDREPFLFRGAGAGLY